MMNDECGIVGGVTETSDLEPFSVSCVCLNEANQMNQINKTNQINQMNQTD